MNRLWILTIVICAAGLASCKKEKQITANELFIAANIGTTTWNAAPQTSITKGDSLQVIGQNDNSTLTFKMAFNGPGTYTLNAGDATYKNTLPVGTGPVLVYNLDPTQTNTVTITQYDVVSNIVQGSFQMHFVWNAGPASTVALTNGKFWMQIPLQGN